MAAALPDYYQQLGIASGATPGEIRRAYRSLALRFHPDKAPQNPFAEAQFLRLKEAYEVLKDPVRRQRYDTERWLRGAPAETRRQAVTAQTIVANACRLQDYVGQIGASAVNTNALQALCLFLLSEAHLALFWEAADTELNESLARPVLKVASVLPLSKMQPVLAQLQQLKPLSPGLQTELETFFKIRQQAARHRRLLPLWAGLLTLLLCLLGWLLVRR